MVLITGGAGFIGSHVVDHLLERGEEVVCVDDFNDFYDPRIKRRNVVLHKQSRRYQLAEGDIRNSALLKDIFNRLPISRIVHLAARAGVRQSVADPFLYEDTNVRGTMNLLEVARLYNVGQFIFASSSSVYGGNTNIPFSEEDQISRTLSPYAATKYAGELMCHVYHHLYGIPVTCLRFFTAYGPRQRPEMAIHKFTRLLYEGKPIPFFGEGETARDYTYIDDIVQGVLAAIDRPFEFEVLNLGEAFCVKLSEVVRCLEEATGRKAMLDRTPAQPGDVGVTYADISKAQRLLGYKPQTSFNEGVRKFVKWYESEERYFGAHAADSHT